MKLLLLFLPIIWFSPDLQSELLDDDGAFEYYRFWNPDVREKVDDYHIWCWGEAALKFTDNDVVLMVNGEWR